jgi:uncharacterized linocin/CFP29 family protein
MQTLRRVGRDTAQLTDEERLFIDNRIVEAVRPKLIARQLFPVFKVDPGSITVRGYKQTDMGQATISLHGQTMGRDRSERSSFDITVPVLHKEFTIWWRDMLAARHIGQPVDSMDAENAAIQVAEEEDKLLLSGEYTGWNALGIQGLATATNRNSQASAGAWPANSLADCSASIGKLEASGHQGPYALILRSSWFAKLRALISNTAVMWLTVVQDLFKAGVFVSDSLYTSAAATTSALVIEPLEQNFELVIGQDLTHFELQDEDMNLKCKVYEIVAPRIKRPTSICELTGLT